MLLSVPDTQFMPHVLLI